VNRLDRETSGLVLVAKKADVARRFGLLMQRRQVKKEYLADHLGLARVGKHSR
jgi:23S rRNA-/tRNA-specific pseudouridylate synthase